MARRGDAIYKRENTWWLDFRHNGQRYQERLGKNINRTVARELAQVRRAAILKGEAGIGKKRKNIAFEEAAELFLKWAEANRKPRTVEFYLGCIKRLQGFFKGKRLGDIHPFLIEKYKQTRVGDGDRRSAKGKTAVNRELATLKALFNRSIEWGKFEGVNPVCKVKFFKEVPRVGYLTEEEESRLLEAASEPHKTIYAIGSWAGLRVKSEALTLQWPQVDLKNEHVTVKAAYAKSGETRTVPLTPALVEALKKLKERSRSEYVFSKPDGTPYRSIRTAFTTACRNARLSGFTPHVLRHTFASRLAMAGVDLRTIQELGGWKTLSMVERYSHLSPDHKRAAIEKIADHFTTVFTTQEKVVKFQSA